MGRRSMIELPYVQSFKDRTGKARHYYRKDGKRVALPGIPGSREFMDTYAACLAEQKPPVEKRPAAAPGTFADLAMKYYGSPKYLNLAPVSRKNYRRVIDAFLKGHGHRLVRQFTVEKVDIIIGGMADRPAAAYVLLKRLHTLLKYAVRLKMIDRNPTDGATSYSIGTFHTWTDAELAQFEARWPSGTKQRLAYALLLYTSQRGSDVPRMAWPHIVDGALRVVQKKTKTELILPLHPALLTELALADRSHIAILTTQYGKPFSIKGFQQWMASAIRAAGLPDRCKVHGIRKASARRLAESDATDKQIMAMTGHKSLSEVQSYTVAANQVKLAQQAMQKQAENDALSNAPKSSVKQA